MTLVPSCSTCGMCVEWLRSCYRSKWYLLSGQGSPPSISGRYYFAEEGIPFYPRVTRLTSRNWYDKNALIGQSLGEDIAEKQKWDNGGMPALNPEIRSVGTTTCIQYGEEPGQAVPASSLVNGFVGDCFVPLPVPPDPWPAMSDYRSCSIQVAYARIIDWLYDSRHADIANVLSHLLGTSYTLNHFPGTPTLPDAYTAVSATASFIWVDGTATFQQAALQAAVGLAPPQNQGILSTLPIWYAQATYLNSLLGIAAANPTGPIFLCGHSMGGAAALLLAARYRAARPERVIRYLTYGCPKPGDERVVDILATCQGICLVNENDIVPTVPPNLELVSALVLLLGAPELFSWPTWQSAPNQVLMDSGGSQVFDANPTLDFDTALAFAIDVLGSLPYPSVSQHVIEEYYKRSLLRCLTAEWPLTTADYARINIP